MKCKVTIFSRLTWESVDVVCVNISRCKGKRKGIFEQKLVKFNRQ